MALGLVGPDREDESRALCAASIISVQGKVVSGDVKLEPMRPIKHKKSPEQQYQDAMAWFKRVNHTFKPNGNGDNGSHD